MKTWGVSHAHVFHQVRDSVKLLLNGSKIPLAIGHCSDICEHYVYLLPPGFLRLIIGLTCQTLNSPLILSGRL